MALTQCDRVELVLDFDDTVVTLECIHGLLDISVCYFNVLITLLMFLFREYSCTLKLTCRSLFFSYLVKFFIHLQNVKRKYPEWKKLNSFSIFYKQYLQDSSSFQMINFQTKKENSSNILKKAISSRFIVSNFIMFVKFLVGKIYIGIHLTLMNGNKVHYP